MYNKLDSTESPSKRFKINNEYMEKPEFLSSGKSNGPWKRKEMRNVNSQTESVTFQWFDIILDDSQGNHLHPNLPVIKLFGVNEEGNSVMATISNFFPYISLDLILNNFYFYVDLPPNWDETSYNLRFIDLINNLLSRSMKSATKFIFSVEIVLKESIFGFHFQKKSKFLKITCESPSFVPKIRQMLQDGIDLDMIGYHRFQCYEANIPFILRFMIDRDITGSNWLEFPPGTYNINKEAHNSNCQLEIFSDYSSLISHPTTGKYLSIAPIRILSFDIECMSEKGAFCDSSKDPIIQIANVISIQGQSDPYIKNIFLLNTCKPIAGAQVFCFKDEHDLLLNWGKFIVECDPDVITGYNINNFDFPYILNRMKILNVQKADQLGRIVGRSTKMKQTQFSSSAYGKSENIEIIMEGRVIFDMIQYMRRNHKLTSYSLNNVSTVFLEQQKEDVKYTDIQDLQNGDDETRRRLAVYCLKDAYLPQQLMDKLLVLINYVEMARVSGVPISLLLSRGQQIKVMSMIYRNAGEDDYIVPTLTRETASDMETYEGATVIDPIKGYYDKPIVTLDFASLYPSIMRAHNLCYSTLLSKEDLHKLSADQYIKTPNGDYFVKGSVHVGILPRILKKLLEQRKIAKIDMAKATDPFIKSVQNSRQLALKISANSVYGFTGATMGQLPCLAISSSVTSFGREMINRTAEYITNVYLTFTSKKYEGAKVIYGDTDSVMVKFKGIETVEEAMKIGREAAKDVSSIFPPPVQLEFEKIYYPYLLMNKKRYAGLYWTGTVKYDKLDAKGIETVRRDNCLLVRNVITTCLEKILIERDIEGAVNFVKQTISDLLQNKLDISLLVITKALGKSATSEGYTAKQAHVELADRMRKRDPGSAPQVGDRVAYVIVEGNKGDPAYLKSEDPIYVLEHNIPIDVMYYVDNQLSKPIQRIFESIIPNPESLLKGDHTRIISKPKPAHDKGIMLFVEKQESCMCCKVPLKNNSAVCENCVDRAPEVLASLMSEIKERENTFGVLWTQCQKCQSSVIQHVLCSSRDCPLFYQRRKVQKDLEDLYTKKGRFNN